MDEVGKGGVLGADQLDHLWTGHLQGQGSLREFSVKTLNQWDERDNFLMHGGKYDLVKMDHSASGSNVDEVDSIVLIKKEWAST